MPDERAPTRRKSRKPRLCPIIAVVAGVGAGVGAVFAWSMAASQEPGAGKGSTMISPPSPGLTMPVLNPARGRRLFAAKGCVVCHSVNGVGGTSGPKLDYTTTTKPHASPFDFSARIWRGAEAMIALQLRDLGYRIELTGDELGDITAFAHSAREQRKFKESDIPERIKRLMRLRNL